MKLNKLTQQDKIRIAAELDGWTDIKIGNPVMARPMTGCLDGRKYRMVVTDNYDLSYDAIIPLIQKQTSVVRRNMSDYLYQTHNLNRQMDATPSQLLDALLVATGKAEI